VIASMTGFATAVRDRDDVSVNVTARAVNHRFLDVQIRLPPSLGVVEASIRSAVQRRLARGRIEMSLSVQDRRKQAVDATLNHALIRSIATALTEARDAGLVVGHLSPTDVLRLPDALTIREAAAQDGGDALIVALVDEAVESALKDLDTMRRREGAFLNADLESRRLGLAETIARLAAAAHDGQGALETRLSRRIHEMNLDALADPSALAQEVVKFVARSDISEEVVRFRAHLDHWAVLTGGVEPCGRKLDFLLQEMNREINTIGSKAEGARVPELIVHAKSELEKMREQVQNVE
jgi:uncharacterized protein (TIGR00255 family)